MEKKYEARIGKYVMALAMCRIYENRGILYAAWDKEMADVDFVPDEEAPYYNAENDIFDEMIAVEDEEVIKYYNIYRKED